MSDVAERLVARYDTAAGSWRRTVRKLGYAAAYRELLEGRGPMGDVLDAGCGTGAFAEAMVEAGIAFRSLHLLDPSREMLDRAVTALADRGVRATRLPCGLASIAEGPERFDTILCAHVIEHFEEPMAALSQLAGALRPGGQLFLVTSRPHWCTTLVRLRWRNRSFGAGAVRDLLRGAGLRPVDAVRFSVGPPSRMSHAFVTGHPMRVEGGTGRDGA